MIVVDNAPPVVQLQNRHMATQVIVTHRGIGQLLLRDPINGAIALTEAYNCVYQRFAATPNFDQLFAGPLGWHAFITEALEDSLVFSAPAVSNNCYCDELGSICSTCVHEFNSNSHIYDIAYQVASGIIIEPGQVGGFFNGQPFKVELYDNDSLLIGNQ